MRFLALVAGFFLVCLTAASAQLDQPPKRIALVVGNGAYSVAEWKLANPARDARLVADRLEALDFQVDLVLDADYRTLDMALNRFGARVKAGGGDVVAIFYYAGHAAQKDEVNFLVPTDADARTALELATQSPPMQRLFNDLGDAGNRVNIIVLDACRDMPLEDEGVSVGGLAPLKEIPNVLVSYATLAGKTASDGRGLPNSPFTAELAQALATKTDTPVESLFAEVSARVYAVTGGAQAPRFTWGLVRAPGFKLSREAAAALRAIAPMPGGVASMPTTDPLRRPPLAPGGFRDCPHCPEMRPVLGGSFEIGAGPGEGGNPQLEGPKRLVRIKPFLAGRFEVTRGEWAAFVAATRRPDPPDRCEVIIGKAWTAVGDWRRPYITQDDRHPAVCITWIDARDYVAWLAATTGKPYRLLSEAEFEYVARAGARGKYWWGEAPAPERANFRDSNNAGTLPVGSYPPNPFGFHDTAGNVMEWVQDCLGYSGYNPSIADGSPLNAQCYLNTRMNRGGGWEADANVLRLAFRNGNLPTVTYASLGFRVARD